MIKIIILLLCYLLGSIPFGILISRWWRGIDIRQYGSGNIGFANVLRILGPAPGIIVLVGDALKGFLAVWLCRIFIGPEAYLYLALAGLLCIVGHDWSIFLKFSGGRGVTTSWGVLLALYPWTALIALASWLIFTFITRYISVGSMMGAISVPFAMWAFHQPIEYVVFGILLAAFVLLRHQPNIKRLINHQEPKIGQKPDVE